MSVRCRTLRSRKVGSFDRVGGGAKKSRNSPTALAAATPYCERKRQRSLIERWHFQFISDRRALWTVKIQPFLASLLLK
jgi:hypothetical protein